MTPLLTPVEAAEMLKVSRDTVYALIRSQELRSVKIRGQYRLRAFDLESYVTKSLSGQEA